MGSGAGQIKRLIERSKVIGIPIRTLFIYYFGGHRNKMCYTMDNDEPSRYIYGEFNFLSDQFQVDGYVLYPKVGFDYQYEEETFGQVLHPKLADFCDVSVFAVTLEMYPLFEKVSALCSTSPLHEFQEIAEQL